MNDPPNQEYKTFVQQLQAQDMPITAEEIRIADLLDAERELEGVDYAKVVEQLQSLDLPITEEEERAADEINAMADAFQRQQRIEAIRRRIQLVKGMAEKLGKSIKSLMNI